MSLIRNNIRKILLKMLYIFPLKITVCSDLKYLKDCGLHVGENFDMQQGCIIDDSHCWMIKIGDDVTLAPNVHILAHDASTKKSLGYTITEPVIIGNNVFIGAGSIILPGVTIGNDVIIGAGSVVSKNIPSNSVAIGNKIIKSYETFVREKKRNFKNLDLEGRVFESEYTLLGGIDKKKKQEMFDKSGGFVI